MTPHEELSRTRYCLANQGVEYLVPQPGNRGEFNVKLGDAAEYSVEWLNVTSGSTIRAKPVRGGGSHTFYTPFGSPAALYLKTTS
jgi:hypothetical protein